MNTKAGAHRVAEPTPPWSSVDVILGQKDVSTLLREAAGHADQLAALRPALAADVGERLRQARGATSRATVAAWLGVHENTIGKIERGESMPDAVQLLQLAAMLSKPVTWLLGVGDGVEAVGGVPPSTSAVMLNDYIFVPLFDVYASAGHGAFDSTERVESMRPFSGSFLRQSLGIPHDKVALVRVAGSSMEPEIRSGDVVLVDREDRAVGVEGAHLVRVDGGLLLKVLQRRPGNRIRVASRNPEFEPFEVDLNGAGTDFEVLGRVRWAGVTFR